MKIAIAGFGLEGKASYDYWNKADNELTIVDQKPIHDLPQGAKTLIGDVFFGELDIFVLLFGRAVLLTK